MVFVVNSFLLKYNGGKVMHEGGWEPFVHHFSSMLGGVVPQDEEIRASGR